MVGIFRVCCCKASRLFGCASYGFGLRCRSSLLSFRRMRCQGEVEGTTLEGCFVSGWFEMDIYENTMNFPEAIIHNYRHVSRAFFWGGDASVDFWLLSKKVGGGLGWVGTFHVGTDGRFARKMLSLCMRVALQMRRNVQHHQALCWWRSGPQRFSLKMTGYSNKHFKDHLLKHTQYIYIYQYIPIPKHIQNICE